MDNPDDLALIFLGVIALSSLVQGLFLAGLAWGGLRVMKRVTELQKAVRDELRPALENVSRISRDLAEASEVATAQAVRLREAVAGASARLEDTRQQFRAAVAGPGGSLRDVFALVKGLRRGMDVYRRLGALHAQERGASRRYADDEHLFI
jgi:hypothetical protein